MHLLRTQMNIVICGHVDHGKSTVVGRLLADTNSLPTGKLDQVRANCERNSKPFEYAFLLDALKDEQSQGITIDAARVFFKTQSRDYIIIDAPGHIEFLKNMVTGASRAEAALLVIDAKEGVKENSKRHGYLLSMLGISQVVVLINKMDLVGYSEDIYNSISSEYRAFLSQVGINPASIIPISGREGDNLVSVSQNMPWYSGTSVLTQLDSFKKEKQPVESPFRLPVQDVYKFTANGDDRRIVAGTIESGRIQIGDEITFYPSGKTAKIATIESFNTALKSKSEAGDATGFTLDQQIYITRGELVAKVGELKPVCSSLIRVNLFWLGRNPLVKGKDYFLKIGTSRVKMKLETVHKLLDAVNLETLESATQINRHDVADCTFRLAKPVAFDLTSDFAGTSRFVIVDDYEISGGGIIKEAIDDANLADNSWKKNLLKWEIVNENRELKIRFDSEAGNLILISGTDHQDAINLAAEKERELLLLGEKPIVISISDDLSFADTSIYQTDTTREQQVQFLSGFLPVLLNNGSTIIISATRLTEDETKLLV
ncbi:MAG: GTP-binding protein [Bacteroidetes bacterium]|nr:GTP-binding protein [Bacteroidota bacterium]